MGILEILGLFIDSVARELRMSVSGFQHHFNREYKSLFGLPPMRDMERLRGTARESISLAAD